MRKFLIAGAAMLAMAAPVLAAPVDDVKAKAGALFDKQFPAGNAASREGFVTCVADAFIPLSDSDLKEVVDADLQPSMDEQARLNGQYPGLNEKLGGCMMGATVAAGGLGGPAAPAK